MCLRCVANIDNEPNGSNKIIIGGFSGLLRIYAPKQRDYRIEDLILEKKLDFPIISVHSGKFVNGSRDVCLAVLHPHRVAVYSNHS